ncbi:hypothetical protein THAOC_17084 [Thalassiosira oceanica]|uniref:BRO1 domain-containing protein n=1 Tax=Thalassiosira oceanica TaxID=159749 RepID=K0SVQ9_THAOC|nr:hypothetical protein THAOC_17084 [Thalassiosira oceanica]|eukprot:EJK62307.1 hypothetical protein THAOC_17084 [Thalassiosira oceanica]
MDDSQDASNPAHPDSVIRLCSAVHRFSIPYINPNDQLSFEESFKSVSCDHATTTKVLQQADNRRHDVKKLMADGKLCHSELSKALIDYLPLINQILLSCKFQPEAARLDKRLLFSWHSGIEVGKNKKKHYFDSEALMFELVMSIATLALSESNVGCNACIEGDFASACREFAKSAGVFQYLGEELLPSWMANSQQHAEMDKQSLAETRVGVGVAFSALLQGVAQQMAVATVLVKPGTPNYALLGKLCCGIAEDLESFVSTIRKTSPIHMGRLDPNFLTLVTFSTNVQQALSLYFFGQKFMVGLRVRKATVAMRTRSTPTSRGLPEIEPNGPLQSLVAEINGFRLHMNRLLKAWEKDNQLVYFDKVPPSVPSNKGLKAIRLKKCEKFELEALDPLPLGAPVDLEDIAGSVESNTAGSESDPPPPSYESAMDTIDSSLAQDLDKQLNM